VTIVYNRTGMERAVERNRAAASRGSSPRRRLMIRAATASFPRDPTLSTPSPASGALGAFLRGVERRGVVFAELQSGDAAAGDAALAATLRGFEAMATRAPLAEWPRRFWSMLLAAPALRGSLAPRLRDGPLAVLAGVGSGPRAALLLRLVAGLSEDDAAAVLGIARPTYRLALQRALPRTEDGHLDIELWRAMGQAAREAIRDVPAGRLRALSLPPEALAAPRVRRAATGPGRARWVWPATWTVLVCTALALAATWRWPELFLPGAEGDEAIRVRELPAAARAAPYEPTLLLLTHRDLEQLLDAGQGDAPPLDPAFDAWLAATLDAPPAGSPRAP
jgi:hypothetical protein